MPPTGRGSDRAATGILVASLVAAAVSLYLTIAHYAGAELACIQSAVIDCAAVTTSSYSLVTGTAVPVSLAGLLWSLVTAGAAIVTLRADPPWLRPALLAWSGAALAVVLYLVNAEIAVIGRICEWCTVLHVLIVAIFFLVLARMREGPTGASGPDRP